MRRLLLDPERWHDNYSVSLPKMSGVEDPVRSVEWMVSAADDASSGFLCDYSENPGLFCFSLSKSEKVHDRRPFKRPFSRIEGCNFADSPGLAYLLERG